MDNESVPLPNLEGGPGHVSIVREPVRLHARHQRELRRCRRERHFDRSVLTGRVGEDGWIRQRVISRRSCGCGQARLGRLDAREAERQGEGSQDREGHGERLDVQRDRSRSCPADPVRSPGHVGVGRLPAVRHVGDGTNCPGWARDAKPFFRTPQARQWHAVSAALRPAGAGQRS
jgi:hypothetical protein